MVTDASSVTGTVGMANDALLEPPETVTRTGTEARLLLTVSRTTSPPEGAVWARVTVPVDGFPPTTYAGSTVIELMGIVLT